MKYLLSICILILFFTCSHSFGQGFGTIRGFVYEKESGEPVIGCSVALKGTKYGAFTDVNGFFTITKIPAGKYTLVSTYLGFTSIDVAINIAPNQFIDKKLYLEKSSVSLKGVDIFADKQEAKTEIKVSVQTVTPKQIAQLPSVGGEPDIVQYLQVLPGVVFTGDQGGQLYIRGGSPIQNKVMLDGMIIYNPFHSIGLFSVFDTEIIRNAEVSTGGFNAQYGGRISAVMDITTRDGSRNKLKGRISTSPFMTKGLLEGPLNFKKDPTNKGSKPTFILSAKSSYLEQTSKVLYSYANEQGKLPFNFLDLYGKTSFKGDNGSKINLFGFNFTDKVNFDNITNINWQSNGLGGNFILIPSASPTLVKGNFAYSRYLITQNEADGKPRTSSINGFNTGLNFTYFINADEINYGFDIIGFRTEFKFFNPANRIIEQIENTTELAGFVKYRMVAKKLVVEPGFRVHYFASLSNTSLEPRLGIKYNITDGLRVKAAAGMYAQNLISAVSDQDVVNLFYGFLSGPDNLPKTFNGEQITHKLQKARHYIAGLEIDPAKNLTLNVEVYMKDFTQLTELNRNKIYDDNEANASQPELLRKDFIIETGLAQGIDFSAKYTRKNFYFWSTYSYSTVTRFDGVQTYYPNFDRRHNINLLTNYQFGKANLWEFSARWNLGSGFPFTQTQGFYEQIQFSDGINTDYTTANGNLGIIYSSLNSGRLPYYHRMDISLRKSIVFERSNLDLNFSVSNLYNRQNIFYFDRVRYTRVNQLPILPSLSIAYEF